VESRDPAPVLRREQVHAMAPPIPPEDDFPQRKNTKSLSCVVPRPAQTPPMMGWAALPNTVLPSADQPKLNRELSNSSVDLEAGKVEPKRQQKGTGSGGEQTNHWMRRSFSRLLPSNSGNKFRAPDMEERFARKPVFANVDYMKEKVRQQIIKRPYCVFDHYKTEGVWQAIARHSMFEHITLFVIGLNAIWIAIDTDWNDAQVLYQAPPLFQVVEHCFAIYFSAELLIRFMAFTLKRDSVRDPWFCFDLLLVALMVLETWVITLSVYLTQSETASTGLGNTNVLRVFRLVRLTRMARMARLLRAVPELVILVKGLCSAARSVFFTLVLLGGVLYVFAIIFCQILRGSPVGDRFFFSVLGSMHTLWIKGALLDDVSDLVTALQQESVPVMLLLDLFLLIATLTVMNMLIGVLCEVVSAVAAAEREDLAIAYARSKLRRIFDNVLDEDHNQNISKSEFVKIIENGEATRTMHDLDVDVVGLVDFADVIFAKDINDNDYDRELSFPEFMEVIVAFRGSNTATVKDIENLRKLICQSIGRCENRIQGIEGILQPHDDEPGTSTLENIVRRHGGKKPSEMTICTPDPDERIVY